MRRETPEQYEARQIRELEAEDPTVGQIFGRGPGRAPVFRRRFAAELRKWQEQFLARQLASAQGR